MSATRTSSRLASRQVKQETPETPQRETPKKRASFAKQQHHDRETTITPVNLMSSESSQDDADSPDEEALRIPPALRRKGRLSKYAKAHKAPLDDLTSARSKFSDILTHISLGEPHEDDADDDVENTDHSLSPPAKMSRRGLGKKSKKNLEEQLGKQTFELTLFDRTVDLAPFVLSCNSDDVPLYPLCREWMHDGHADDLSHLRSGDHDSGQPGDDDKLNNGVNRLPDPISMSAELVARGVSPRVPLSVVKPYVHLEDMDDAMANEQPIDPRELLIVNQQRWRSVRQDWKQASLDNEQRYKHSCDVLKAMYEKSISAQNIVEPKIEPIDSPMML